MGAKLEQLEKDYEASQAQLARTKQQLEKAMAEVANAAETRKALEEEVKVIRPQLAQLRDIESVLGELTEKGLVPPLPGQQPAANGGTSGDGQEGE